MAREKKYVFENAKLMSEWHWEKNNALGFDPHKITVGSACKAFWKCSKGHEWDAQVKSRNSGVGCPVCSGHKIVVGVNDLATVRPDLAAQWHPTRNGNLKSTDVIAHNDTKVWWVCEKGHEWEAKISNRTNGTNCPVCAGKKVLVGENDLATTHPHLVDEWDFTRNGNLTPNDVTAGSNKKVYWICKKGHEWKTSISNRSRQGTKCPICAGELKTSFPEQAIFFYLRQITTAYNRYMIDDHTEIDIYLPDHKIGIEYDGAYFHEGGKAKQREQKKQEKLNSLGIILIRVREIEENENKYIIYSKPRANDTDLTQTLQILMDRIGAIIQIPIDIDINITRDRNSIYEQYIQSEKDNSLLMINPKLASEWHSTKNGSLLPEFVSVGCNKKVWWKCEKGHEWEAVINSRGAGTGCPFCAGQKVTIGYNDLATKNPELAKQWNLYKNGDLTPRDITEQSNRNVWWQCEMGHEWKASVTHRSRGGNCPICSGHKVLPGFNDLATLNPKLASEWHPTKNGPLTASDVTLGSKKKVFWMCKNGHEWQAAIYSRNSGRGCPYCANKWLLIGYNDLATVYPQLANEWHPTKNGFLKVTDLISGSNQKVWWLGQCGHEWEAVVSSRIAGRSCPYCSSRKLLKGFNDLATVNPELALEWHPTRNGELTPSDVMPGTNKNVWWLCKKGHEWQNVINTRNGGNGCPYCANQMVLKGYNDLVTLNPNLALEWHPIKNGVLTASDFTPGSNKKVWWLCKFNHEWEALISSRNKGHGCPQCAIERRTKK